MITIGEAEVEMYVQNQPKLWKRKRHEVVENVVYVAKRVTVAKNVLVRRNFHPNKYAH